MKPQRTKERRWLVFNNGCIHGVQHSELVVVRSSPNRSLVHDSVAVFTISKTFTFITALAVVTALVLLLAGCQMPRAQKGGSAATIISRAGHTNKVTLAQSDNPKEPSQQKVQSEQTIEYVLPAGTVLGLGDGSSKFGDSKGGITRHLVRQSRSLYVRDAPHQDVFNGRKYLTGSIRGVDDGELLCRAEQRQRRRSLFHVRRCTRSRRRRSDKEECIIGRLVQGCIKSWTPTRSIGVQFVQDSPQFS